MIHIHVRQSPLHVPIFLILLRILFVFLQNHHLIPEHFLLVLLVLQWQIRKRYIHNSLPYSIYLYHSLYNKFHQNVHNDVVSEQNLHLQRVT